jgi:hypothetical protein
MFQHKVQLSDSETLSLRWTADWSLLTIKFNTTQLENITDKSVLEAGKWFTLPTGKNLFVRLVKGELEVWDGTSELMSGLKSGQSDNFGQAWKMLLAFGIILTLLGIAIASVQNAKIEYDLVYRFIFCALGSIYIGLALWARKTKEKAPLKIAIGVHSIFLLCMSIGGILRTILNSMLFYSLYKGLKAEPLKTTKFESVEDTGLLDDDL